jgi:hypothetical protein
MQQPAKEWAMELISLYGGNKALQTSKDILAMYTRGLNAYGTSYYKKVVEEIEISIETVNKMYGEQETK